ncbi:MAG: hypothetical protein APR56_04875 [Methanosaeta sp. SDB]|nr:MAG: hypothetical protein APR56_04875 [Methanosaeta sp. SDB]
MEPFGPNLFIRQRAGHIMFEPEEESIVLEIVCGILDISPDEMMNIGDAAKEIIIFDPSLESKETAVGRLKEALKDMSKEEAVVAGMFISGLLRCNLEQQYMRAMAENERCEDSE